MYNDSEQWRSQCRGKWAEYPPWQRKNVKDREKIEKREEKSEKKWKKEEKLGRKGHKSGRFFHFAPPDK